MKKSSRSGSAVNKLSAKIKRAAKDLEKMLDQLKKLKAKEESDTAKGKKKVTRRPTSKTRTKSAKGKSKTRRRSAKS